MRNLINISWLVFFISIFWGTAYGVEIPSGFGEINSAAGVKLFGSHDSTTYVQVVDLSKGAKVRFLTNSIADPGTGKGVYGGNNPTINKKPISDIWDNRNADNYFSLCNGALFGDGKLDYLADDNVLVYPIIADNNLISGGSKVNENGKYGLRMLEIWNDKADIRNVSSSLPKPTLIKNQTTAPNVLVGSAVDSGPDSAPEWKGRTMAGVLSKTNNGIIDTVVILVSRSSTIQNAVQTLRNFGVKSDDKVVMFDGADSSQLIAMNKSGNKETLIWGNTWKQLPQTIGIQAGVNTLAPVPTPSIDKSSFVSDGTYVDNTRVNGGTSFTKEWTIKNVGTTTWNSSYKLKYVSGARLSSVNEIAVSGSVPPNSSYTFKIPMYAPSAQSSEKTYKEDWKLTAPAGSTINVGNSSTVWVQIKVPAIVLVNKVSFVSENYSDNTKVTGGASFTKEWTIKNVGTTTWNSSYKLKYVSGGRLSGTNEVAVSGSVPPNSSYTFKVPMYAPSAQTSEKTYKEDWKLTAPSGSTINVGNSSTVWVQIKVPAIVLVDKVSFVSENYSDNTKVTGGTSFTKEWSVKNTGNTTWNSSYKLKYVSGGRLSSTNEVAVSGSVPPGSSYKFKVSMKAPTAQSSEKTYREDWKLTAPSGSTINVGNSSTVWVQIKVPKK